jgi:hypothetical protein
MVKLHHTTGITDPPQRGSLMAIQPQNYSNLTFAEIHGIQKVYIGDYEQSKVQLSAASELYKSGATNTKAALKEVKRLVRVKLAILEDINILGRILDERDGTISTATA